MLKYLYLLSGFGVNVENTEPTLSVNQILKMFNLQSVTVEEILAKTFNNLEILIELYNSDVDYGHYKFEKLFCSHLLK